MELDLIIDREYTVTDCEDTKRLQKLLDSVAIHEPLFLEEYQFLASHGYDIKALEAFMMSGKNS